MKQSIGMNGIGNARELGGYISKDGRRVKHGVLLRTAGIGHATESDLRLLSDKYHVETVVDLRMDDEVMSSPDPEVHGAENVHISIMDKKEMESEIKKKNPELYEKFLKMQQELDLVPFLISSVDMGIVSDRLYIDFVTSKSGRNGYRKFFECIESVSPDRAFLFHCTQGKDRTGVAAMLILSALEISEETILKDYMLTNKYNEALIRKEREMLRERLGKEADTDKYLSAMDQVDSRYMENVLLYLKKTYGSVRNYITEELGQTEKSLEQLKEKFLE